MYAQAVAAARASGASVAAARATAGAAAQAVQRVEPAARTGLSCPSNRPGRTAAGGLGPRAADRSEARRATETSGADQAERNLATRESSPRRRSVCARVSVVGHERAGRDRQLLTIVPLDDVWITANFKEDAAATQCRARQRVEIRR